MFSRDWWKSTCPKCGTPLPRTARPLPLRTRLKYWCSHRCRNCGALLRTRLLARAVVLFVVFPVPTTVLLLCGIEPGSVLAHLLMFTLPLLIAIQTYYSLLYFRVIPLEEVEPGKGLRIGEVRRWFWQAVEFYGRLVERAGRMVLQRRDGRDRSTAEGDPAAGSDGT